MIGGGRSFVQLSLDCSVSENQTVELINSMGHSINDVIAKALSIKNNSEKFIADGSAEMLSAKQSESISSIMSADYNNLSSYLQIPQFRNLNAVVLNVQSVDLFYACSLEDWKKLIEFQERIQFVVKSSPKSQEVEVGQFVLIRSGKDDLWYRGTVMKIHKKQKVSVYCPDFGFIEKISGEDLRTITDEFVATAKYWAIPCTLLESSSNNSKLFLTKCIEDDKHFQVKQVTVRVHHIDADRVSFVVKLL